MRRSVGLVVGLGLVACGGLGWFLAGQGLSDRAAWANIASLFVAIAGVGVGLLSLRRAPTAEEGRAKRSQRAFAGRNVYQAGRDLSVGATRSAGPSSAEGKETANEVDVQQSATGLAGSTYQGGRDVNVDPQ
jgi:hypothetical protein